MLKKYVIFFLSCFLVGCSNASLVVPTPTMHSYPAVEHRSEKTDFTLDSLQIGQKIVKGTGVPRTPIVVNDLGEGRVLGRGVVESDGIFQVNVPDLFANQWIGIQLDTDNANGITIDQFYGCTKCKDIPSIGVVLIDGYVK